MFVPLSVLLTWAHVWLGTHDAVGKGNSFKLKAEILFCFSSEDIWNTLEQDCTLNTDAF